MQSRNGTAERTKAAEEVMKTERYFSPFVLTIIALFTHAPALAQNFWEQTNGPYGGEVYALAINSSGHIFAGTFLGGIFRSTDNGGIWTQINAGLPNTIVFSLAVNSSEHIFAGTGGGVFRSTDNGESWTQINTGLTNTDIDCFAINSSGHIFVGTWGGRCLSFN